MTGRAAAVAAAATLLGVLGAPAGADAATTLPPDSFGPACPTYGSDQICSGAVPSWDSTPLDVDVTLPSPGTGSSHPLVVMLHGFGNNKHEWESTTDEG